MTFEPDIPHAEYISTLHTRRSSLTAKVKGKNCDKVVDANSSGGFLVHSHIQSIHFEVRSSRREPAQYSEYKH